MGSELRKRHATEIGQDGVPSCRERFCGDSSGPKIRKWGSGQIGRDFLVKGEGGRKAAGRNKPMPAGHTRPRGLWIRHLLLLHLSRPSLARVGSLASRVRIMDGPVTVSLRFRVARFGPCPAPSRPRPGCSGPGGPPVHVGRSGAHLVHYRPFPALMRPIGPPHHRTCMHVTSVLSCEASTGKPTCAAGIASPSPSPSARRALIGLIKKSSAYLRH